MSCSQRQAQAVPPGDWLHDTRGEGPDLVLLHGLGASSFSWRHNLAPLARHFRVTILDLPGHGKSPAPLQADYRLETLVQGLADFIDLYNLAPVAVAGNSLGGSLALLLAQEFPEKVAALIMLAPAVALTRLPYVFYPLRVPGLGLMVAALMGPWFLPWFLRLAYYDASKVTPEVIAGYAAPFRDLNHRLALRRFCRQMRLRPLGQIAAMLGKVSQPPLLLWGAEDRILPVNQGYWLKKHLPQADFHVLEQVGHAPQEEAPGAVNKIIIDFLRRTLKN